MIPPATPGARSPSLTPATPGATISSPAAHTTGTSTSPIPLVPRTPGGSALKICSADLKDFTVIKIHTAKCTECDSRNLTSEMLRCPGCGWQICLPCQTKRNKQGRNLVHGGMGSPGGLLGLRSGGVSKRRVLGGIKSPAPAKEEQHKQTTRDGIVELKDADHADEAKTLVKGKGKVTAAPKSAHKKRPTNSASDTAADLAVSIGRRPTSYNHTTISQGWNIDMTKMPEGRIHELIRENGVDVPGQRYGQHFLERYEPVVSSPVIAIPEVVRRMGDKERTLSAVEKMGIRNKVAFVREYEQVLHFATTNTVRHLAETTADTHIAANPHLSADETQELSSALKECARRWAARTHAKLPFALQRTVDRTLDMRLDHIDAVYKAHLERLLRERAEKKLGEFEDEKGPVRGSGDGVGDKEMNEDTEMDGGDEQGPLLGGAAPVPATGEKRVGGNVPERLAEEA
ncbi:hypothetical protein EK21DRAFT_73864 [Setomelanomma holmii]|uniref:Uncharacterized protein n=1 Tax=Setomelanomma holmii TaxID=210430 RepID=A0A9P4H3W8_9PLEO|nr:hypothetical protein EK21DRAFT_73864 [Setomelanomma holmii]